MFTVDGAYDLHLHALPDIQDRNGDELTFARACRAAGMAGFAIKNVFESTASRAYYVNMLVEGFRYIGGICLNYPVGGINPTAVDGCLQMGGRIVWMPSGHSLYSKKIKGRISTWACKSLWLPEDPGITILDADGELTEETKAVVSIVKEHNAMIATSHLSPEECMKLIRYCGKEHVKTVWTHMFWSPEYTKELGREAIENGAKIELTAVTFGGFKDRFKCTLSEGADAIRYFGAQNVILSSDSGGEGSIVPHEILRLFGYHLMKHGITESELRVMMNENPLALISE